MTATDPSPINMERVGEVLQLLQQLKANHNGKKTKEASRGTTR